MNKGKVNAAFTGGRPYYVPYSSEFVNRQVLFVPHFCINDRLLQNRRERILSICT